MRGQRGLERICAIPEHKIIPSVNGNYHSLCLCPALPRSEVSAWSILESSCCWHHSQPVLEFNSLVTRLSWSWAVLTPRVPGKQSCSFSLAGFWPRSGSLRSCCPRRGAHSKSGEELIQPHKGVVMGETSWMSICALGTTFSYDKTWKCIVWRGLNEEQGEGRDWWTSQWGGVCAPWLPEEHRSWWLCFCLVKSLHFRLLGSASASRAFCMYTQTCVGVEVLSTFHTEPIPIKYSSEEDSHLYVLYYSGWEIFQWLSCCLQDLDTGDKTGGSLIFYI